MVVAWYLPGHVKPALDVRRSLAMLSFRTANGQPFDGVALNIESTRLRNADLRSRRAVALAQRVRGQRGRRRSRSCRSTRAGSSAGRARGHGSPGQSWRRPRTPSRRWCTRAARSGFDATYGYVTRALRLLRAQTGNPDVPIHVAGGVADRMGPEELAGFVAAVADDGAVLGVSLYDWQTTRPAAWRARSPQPARQRGPVARLEQVLGQHLHVREHGHEVRVPCQRGTTWRWTWSAMPAPAARPRFQPRLKPAGP